MDDHEDVPPDDVNKESGGRVCKPAEQCAVCMQLLKHATCHHHHDFGDDDQYVNENNNGE